MALLPGQLIDLKYRVIRLIGEGGMGTVYEGENVRIGRRVAIKVLNAQFATQPELMARFEREARAAARIGSANICDVLDLGDLPNNERFIVMEFLEGQSLEQRLTQRGRLTLDEFVPIAYELLEALATMHDAGVIHRDLKPANVHLARTSGGRGEVVKVLDFGVSKFLPMPGDIPEMTATGMLMGTPLYMSPEQAKGVRDIDARSDLYSASVIFYRALTGTLPFAGRNFNELLFKIVLDKPKPIRELAPDIDPELAAIVHKGLGHSPELRHATARAYQDAIVAWAWGSARGGLSAVRASRGESPFPVEEVVPSSTLSGSQQAPGWSDDGRKTAPRGTLASAGPVDPGPRTLGTPAPVAWWPNAPDVGSNVAAGPLYGPPPGMPSPGVPPLPRFEEPAEIPRRSAVPWILAGSAFFVVAALGMAYGLLQPTTTVPTTGSPAPAPREASPTVPAIAPIPQANEALSAQAHETTPSAIPERQPPRRTFSLPKAPAATAHVEPAPPPSAAPVEVPPPPPSAAPTSTMKRRKYRTTLD